MPKILFGMRFSLKSDRPPRLLEWSAAHDVLFDMILSVVVQAQEWFARLLKGNQITRVLPAS